MIDEWIAEQVLVRRSALLEPTLTEMRARRKLVGEWIEQEPLLECVPPQGGVVCFPHMRADPPGGTAAFYQRLLETHGTMQGSGSSVRDVGFLFPAGLWLAHSRGTRGGTYGDFTGAAGLTMASELFSKIKEASAAIYPQVSVTPLEPSSPLSAELGCQVLLKYEHMQPTGSFKIRGATNKVRVLGGPARRAGVLTASTGNHGVAVSRAGGLAGVPVKVYVSNVTVPTKLGGYPPGAGPSSLSWTVHLWRPSLQRVAKPRQTGWSTSLPTTTWTSLPDRGPWGWSF